MGGICIDQLTETVTHLVTDSVRSKKYEVKLIFLIYTSECGRNEVKKKHFISSWNSKQY